MKINMFSNGLFFALTCIVASIFAAPSNIPPELQPSVIPILSQSEELQPNGTYKFSYETGNGIIREESAYDKLLPKSRDASSNEGGESNESEEIHVQRGSYSYTAPDGSVISVRYIADENGFQPIYEHIPNQGSVNSAEKSGRALKLDTSETLFSLAPRIGSSQSNAVNSDGNNKPQVEVSSEALSEPEPVPKVESIVVPEPASTSAPEALSVAVPESALANIPQEIPVTDSKADGIAKIEPTAVSEDALSAISDSAPAAIPESALAALPKTTLAAEAATAVDEDLTISTENSESVTESGVTEASEAVTPNVDVSTEVASSAVPDQPSTEPEQGITASAELPSPTAEQLSTSEVVELPSSTLAPEQSSTTEAIGQQAIEESVASSPTEEVGQPATNASESASPEESSSTTIST